tara:strand:+ start:1038 stop:1280 length:243 start_codon:yes stop_codon:yes gene_type:complete
MQFIKGYQYFSEQEAINARESCDAFYGIPVTPDDITQNWVDYNFAELNTPRFWYIVFDASLLPILGTATTFEVVTPPFPG